MAALIASFLLPAQAGSAPSPELDSRLLPVPTSTEYNHNGAQTMNRYNGAQATVEVTDPDVDHNNSPDEFVASRIMAKKYRLQQWLEVGWAEVSWKDDRQYVYTYSDESTKWQFHERYELVPGQSYSFRVYGCALPGDGRGTCAAIYWNGQWELLRTSKYGCTYVHRKDPDRRCFIEEYTEVYSVDSSPEPTLGSDNDAVEWSDAQLLVGKTWSTWNDTDYESAEGSVDSYSVCWLAKNHDFYVIKGTCS
ncbi:MAG TPA: hypothetical protein VNP73_07950 [Actinomycetota bacterium]|nr:hypothetical protein [Actinomycetota bacterium]